LRKLFIQRHIFGNNFQPLIWDKRLERLLAPQVTLNLAGKKIKKEGRELTLRLKRTPDILKTVGEGKRKGQIVVGFAAETENLRENALKKIKRKNLDLIVANSVREGVFGSDRNSVVLINRNGMEREFSGSKEEVAFEILKEVSKLLPSEDLPDGNGGRNGNVQ